MPRLKLAHLPVSAITLSVLVLLGVLASGPAHGQSRAPKVLLVGIDGCRFDAIQYSQAEVLKDLIRTGAYSDQCDVLDDKGTPADTASGSGWSTILTGVWADRHRVYGNDFSENRLKECPSLFHLVEKSKPELTGVALVTWPPIQQYILRDHAGCRLVVDGDQRGYQVGDRLMAEAAVKVLKEEDPDLLFLYFGHVDGLGHGYGFHPKSPKYTNGIEEVDGHLKKIFQTLKERKSFADEDWLFMVFTDHGGQGRGHGGGRTIPETRMGFLILQGDSVEKGAIKDKITNADIVPTALAHLGIRIEREWRLEGNVVGLKNAQ